MKLPVEFISDARMKADFMAFLNADTPQEQERILKDYNDWFSRLSPESQSAVIESRMESMRHFLTGARENLEMLDFAVNKEKRVNKAGTPIPVHSSDSLAICP